MGSRLAILIVIACSVSCAAVAEESLPPIDEARIYFAPWEDTYTLALTVERLKANPPVVVELHGWLYAAPLEKRFREDSSGPRPTSEETVDVRLVIDFLSAGKVVRSIYATEATVYDQSGTPLRAMDEGFKQELSSLRGLWAP